MKELTKKCLLKIKEAITSWPFIFAISFSLFWYLLAHLYVFCNFTLSHDLLGEYHQDASVIRHFLQIGRFSATIIFAIKGYYVQPVVTALFAFIYLFVTVFILIKMFDFKHPVLIGLLSGFLIVNITVTCQAATYMQGLDTNLLALMLCTIASYLWLKNKKFVRLLIALPLIVFALGLYQSYISILITLIMIVTMVRILKKEEFKHTIIHLGLGALLVIVGMILYYGVSNLVVIANKLSLEDRVTIADLFKNNIFIAIKDTYVNWFNSTYFHNTFANKWVTFSIHIALTIGMFTLLGFFFANKETKAINKIVLGLLLLFLPFGMNVTYLLSGGNVHELMIYSFWLVYLLFMLVAANSKDYLHNIKAINIANAANAGLIFTQIVLAVITSYKIYIKKTVEAKDTKIMMTEILKDVRSVVGYVDGETTVVFLGGKGSVPTREEFKDVSDFVGCWWGFAIGAGYPEYYENYFKYVMPETIKVGDYFLMKDMEKNDIVEAMPSYPTSGYAQMIEGTVVVKLSGIYLI